MKEKALVCRKHLSDPVEGPYIQDNVSREQNTEPVGAQFLRNLTPKILVLTHKNLN